MNDSTSSPTVTCIPQGDNVLLKRIGIISDTHNFLDSQVMDIFAGCDLILHAGDVCREGILEQLRNVAPVTIVQGNNDFFPNYPDSVSMTLNNVRFTMVHILPQRLPQDCDWLIFGHTHRPDDRLVEGVRLFNPGTAGKANKGAPRQVTLLSWKDNKWEPQRILL
jgi:putative phosphoesterase